MAESVEEAYPVVLASQKVPKQKLFCQVEKAVL